MKMINTTATDAEQATYVHNIMSVYARATADQKRRGRDWYPAAHQLASMLTDGDVRAGAGVLAALSANKRWSENQRLAKEVINGNIGGHFRDALDKAEKILDGASPEDILPMSIKTGNFYRCILDPSDPDAVVIDRHAHDVAVGQTFGKADRGLSVPTRYATLAHAYREAARKLGELPSVVQAVTWLVQIEDIRGHN